MAFISNLVGVIIAIPIITIIVVGDMQQHHAEKKYEKIIGEAMSEPKLCNKLPLSAGSGFDYSFPARKACYEEVLKKSTDTNICEKLEIAQNAQRGKGQYRMANLQKCNESHANKSHTD